MNLKKYNIKHSQSILSWDEGLPLGSGKQGLLIYGDGPLKFSLDRNDLWDIRPNPRTLTDEFNFQNLVKYSRSGSEEDWQKRIVLFEKILREYAYPSKITAGRIELDFGEKTKNITGEVDLKTAVASLSSSGEKPFSIEAFVSAKTHVCILKIYGEYTLNLHIPKYISGDENGEWYNQSGVGKSTEDGCMRYPKAEIICKDGFTYYVQNTLTELIYGVFCYEKVCDGYKEIYCAVGMNGDGEDFEGQTKAMLKEIASFGYDELKKEHLRWWKNYWKKSELSVGDELLEKVYYRSYYLFASCSRKGYAPMALQGVWTADNDSIPPWKGGYFNDTNTQMSYQSYLKANRLDEGYPFIEWMLKTRPAFRKFAKEFYGVKGLIIPVTSTLDGKPMGGWAQYTMSPVMTIWAIQSFDEYYLYTDNKKFLEEKAYPYFKEVGEAILGILEERNGKLYLPLSCNPELFDNTREAYIEPNSNYDLALLRYLYETLIRYSDILGKEKSKYEEILSKLDEIAVGESGVLLAKDRPMPESHRHFSHVMCLYPLHLINYDTPEHKAIYDATILKLEQLGTGWWVGFSFAMMGQLCAIAERGNAAYENLRIFASAFVAENGFHLNGDYKNYGYSQFHYRPFTLEASFGYCDALQEMLLQEHKGYIHLFPATAEQFGEKLEFKNFRSYHGVVVSAMKKADKVTANFKVKRQTTVKVLNVFGAETLLIADKNGEKLLCVPQGETFELTLLAGETKVSGFYY